MLALLEDIIRQGSINWEASPFISAASMGIIQDILIPNLIWRAGRVEATIRKVALAACYGILKAGATQLNTLRIVAPTLVPLLVSSLEDTHSDVTPRSMACLCLTIIFDRLKGCFGEQSLREVYHPLLKRLDDSDDSVRIAVCSTLIAFFNCAPPSEFRYFNLNFFYTSLNYNSSTVISYSSDQLFIHLDDSVADVQDAVFQVLVEGLAKIDAQTVLKKAESNKISHRNPHLCDKVTLHVRKNVGLEVM